MKKAIIDIGSNTINLLIGEIGQDKSLHVYHDEKIHAKLARGGINNGQITPEAFERGLRAIEHYVHMCHIHKVDAENIKAYATATIRNTSNGAEFTNALYQQFGVNTEVIDGNREAMLIFNGVRHGIPELKGNFLVLDIGGGSTEFIIAGKSEIIWKQSFELGVSKLLDLLMPSDPLTDADAERITNYLNEHLVDLDTALLQWDVSTLVGSSGSFDTLKSILTAHKEENNSNESYYKLNKNELTILFKDLIGKTTQERLLVKGMDAMRAEYMPIATLLIDLVLKKTGIDTIYQCSYALKEGALYC